MTLASPISDATIWSILYDHKTFIVQTSTVISKIYNQCRSEHFMYF